MCKGWTQEKDRESDFIMYLPEEQTEHFMIRGGIPTGPVLKRSTARNYLQTVTWERVLMTWNENNLNIAFNDPKDTIERWEGVINAASTDSGYYMPRIGAPDCGPYNKRYELVLKPSGPNEFYFNPADHRVHIKTATGAGSRWITTSTQKQTWRTSGGYRQGRHHGQGGY